MPSRQFNPRGKPAGLRPFLKVRNGADVALLMPSDNNLVTHLILARASQRKRREAKHLKPSFLSYP